MRNLVIAVAVLGCRGRDAPSPEPVPVPTPSPRAEPQPAPPGVTRLDAAGPQGSEAVAAMTTAGDVRIIELATKDGPLGDQLMRLRASAKDRRFVVETTAEWCKPCQAIAKYLRDPAMTSALAGVTLARVDVDVFGEELDGIGLPSSSVPWFVILGGDGQPVDMMSSNEWDADIPANMAPVLHAFVTGTYAQRRHPWRRP